MCLKFPIPNLSSPLPVCSTSILAPPPPARPICSPSPLLAPPLLLGLQLLLPTTSRGPARQSPLLSG
ncbi:unnamed protein product [Urochloa humidicola]